MKHMNESERILAIFGTLIASGALVLSLATEFTARSRLAEAKRLIAARAPATIDRNRQSYIHHIGYQQQTLAGRWSFPDGHASLGIFVAAFGVFLVVVPRKVSRRRLSST